MRDDFRFRDFRECVIPGCQTCAEHAKESSIMHVPSHAPIELSLANAGIKSGGPMNKKAYIEYHGACTAKMRSITIAKNADYTGKGDDPFANFSRVELLGICSTEQGFLTRMTDKLSRLASYCERGELSVKDESVEDTLLDLANYCILMAGFLKGKRDA